MKMVVGLGNPGRKYAETRHNIGFALVEELARRHRGRFPRAQFQGETIEILIEGEKVLLLRPLTYYNRSGESTVLARDFFKLENSELLVVCDDFNLPLGKLRIRTKGSSGGSNGLADIIQRFGSDEFPRLRIGTGPVPPSWDPADFVLSRFQADEQPIVTDAVRRAAEAVEAWSRYGIHKCMNQFNAG